MGKGGGEVDKVEKGAFNFLVVWCENERTNDGENPEITILNLKSEPRSVKSEV